MIKRYPTRCTLCGHTNTLRVTLGINARQRHTFECQGCGEDGVIELSLDFIDREVIEIPGLGKITGPRITDVKLENAEWTQDEGTITNLDPTFLVPEDQLHQEGAFPWMHAMKDVARIAEDEGPRFRDIIDEAGMARGIREGIAATLKSIELRKRGKGDLARVQLDELTKITGVDIQGTPDAIAIVVSAFIGKSAYDDVHNITKQAKRAFELSPRQFKELRVKLLGDVAPDFLDRQLGVLKDYSRGYDQLSQAWFYAAKGVTAEPQLQPSARALDLVRHFYGTAFEQLSSGLVLPACLNNILNGRQYDQFERMDLKQYLSTDKSGRARCIEGRIEFLPLWSEFDSALRNGSHHQGLRIKQNSKYTIQYRTGDTKPWQDISYSDYLIRCNKIQICLLKLVCLQMFVFGKEAFEVA
jgi:hypothetical protein